MRLWQRMHTNTDVFSGECLATQNADAASSKVQNSYFNTNNNNNKINRAHEEMNSIRP